ncbi:BspA family leucine-rich repeat surface protein [Helicobacter bizzozeronii]|uniref:BspA family leucine-rich repeat surface protein n=1 Tax=Helicobacter bizzozeronii TaxID=56877 RepID=UPI000CF175DB|nr:BspA family leucine-rich repeat surface protein [Helicobacter bizzozeronii]
MQQALENLAQELKNIKRAMRLAKSALEEGLEVQQEAQELHASFSAFMQVLGGALKALREHYTSLKEDDLELEKSLTQLKHAQAKITAPLSVLEKPSSAQEVLEVLEGLQNSITDLESVLEGLHKPSQSTPQNFATPKGAKKYIPQSKEELKKLVADESVYLGDIDIGNLEDLSDVFEAYDASSRRQNFEGLETWDVSNVKKMSYMFSGCIDFNYPLNNWDASKVEQMNMMFQSCRNFNQSLDSWDVSKVWDMSFMFAGCAKFNQPLEKWDVSKVEEMGGMFQGCINFNHTLHNWNVSEVWDMEGMFENCKAFNQSLEKWDVSKVKRMEKMFEGCTSLTTLPHWYRA